MTLHEFKALLGAHPDKSFRLVLPDGQEVPQAFHITEVGQVSKNFIDCGGTVRSLAYCSLQVWLGPEEDRDHRIRTEKLASILTLAQSVVPHDFLDIEFEYEGELISQFPVASHSVSDDAVTLQLTTKHTACLAPELCVVPGASGGATDNGCTPGGGCC